MHQKGISQETALQSIISPTSGAELSGSHGYSGVPVGSSGFSWPADVSGMDWVWVGRTRLSPGLQHLHLQNNSCGTSWCLCWAWILNLGMHEVRRVLCQLRAWILEILYPVSCGVTFPGAPWIHPEWVWWYPGPSAPCRCCQSSQGCLYPEREKARGCEAGLQIDPEGERFCPYKGSGHCRQHPGWRTWKHSGYPAWPWPLQKLQGHRGRSGHPRCLSGSGIATCRSCSQTRRKTSGGAHRNRNLWLPW